MNVRGSFLMTKHSLIEMKKRNYGRILLIASIAGKEVHIIYYPLSARILYSTHTHTHRVMLECLHTVVARQL